MIRRAALLPLLLILGIILHAQGTDPAYQKELQRLYKGTVPTITPAELAAKPAKPVLLDTRSRQEYSVSHIPGALFVAYDQFQENSLAHLDRGTPLVVYCTVGYRSERIGERLKAMGFRDVRNLYGGIFEWANQGHPLQGPDGAPTTRVHTYDKAWSRWLLKGTKVY